MAHTDPLSIRQLEVFVALVDQGSFTQAARHLGLSQSTVSGHMADPENRLGMRLVGRERSGVTPTGAGGVLLKPARDALRAERTARMAAAELSGLLQGSLSVGGSTIPAVYIIPPLLSAFRSRHEGVTISLVTGDSSEVLEFVQGGDVDVGVVGIRPRGRGLQCERVGGDELVMITPPEHPFAERDIVGREDILDEPIVMREPGSGTREVMLESMGFKGSERELDVACHVGSTEAVKAAVRAGLGISFVSSLAVRDEIAAATLVVTPVRGLAARRDFYLVARDPQHLSPAGRAFWAESLSGEKAATG